MKYALEDLLRIRRWREEKAQREVVRMTSVLDQALHLVMEKEKRLSEFLRWRLQTEDRLFGEIVGKDVRQRNIEDLGLKISLMREDEAVHEKALQESREAARTAGKELDESRGRHRLAMKETQKILEHKRLWLAEAMKTEEQEIEKELEDFVPKSEHYDEEWKSCNEDI